MVKKKKKPKLTKEERKARRLARKEAARLRRIEKEVQARRDQLDRETRATEMNAVVIKRKWRDIMRRARAPQLYDDFLTLRLRTERLIDMKSAMIDELMDALDEANDQYNTNLQHHVETIDKLLDFYHCQMERSNEWYRRSLAALGAILAEQRDAIKRREDHDQGHLELVLYSIRERVREDRSQRTADITVKIDDENVKSAEVYHVMQTSLEGKLERMWEEIKLTLQQHNEQNADRRAAVAKLMAKEQAEYQVIAEQKRRTRLLYRQIEEGVEFMQAWDTSDLSDRWAELRALRHERNEFKSGYIALRDTMDAEREHDKRQLRHLVVESETALQRLQDVARQGDKILSMACVCRGLEGQEERLPFPESIDGDDYEAEYWVRGVSRTAVAGSSALPRIASAEPAPRRDGDDVVGSPAEDDSLEEEDEEETDFVEETISCLEDLTNFWAHAGAVEAGRRQLQARVSQLRAENRQLHGELREYLRCVAPSWAGPEPVPRGPPTLRVYQPPRGHGSTPWRGARTLGLGQEP